MEKIYNFSSIGFPFAAQARHFHFIKKFNGFKFEQKKKKQLNMTTKMNSNLLSTEKKTLLSK